MGVQDLDARFNAVEVGQGTIAKTAVEALREAARTVNDLVQGEPYQLVTFIQACEMTAHQARLYLNFTPDVQPGVEQDPPMPGDEYRAKSIGDLKSEITRRNRDADEADQMPVSGNKEDLVQRLIGDDRKH